MASAGGARLYCGMSSPTLRSIHPRVPIAPILSRASFARRGGAGLPCMLDAGPARLVTSGRIAIALALREMGVGAGDAVLVPAWHSLSMVPPVLWRGAEPLFYGLDPGGAVDLDAVAALLAPRVKAIIVTHYFGIAQDSARIRAFCDAHGLLMLEDCAHSFFGRQDGLPVGAFGDYAIGSSMKFLPTYEGGCLVSARRPLDGVALRWAGAGFEAKSALAALERSFAYGRLAALGAVLRLPLALKDRLWQGLRARRPAAAAELAPSSSDSSAQFETRWLDKRSSLFSRAVLRLAGRARIVALRRRHYLALEQALGALPGCRPLFARLPDGACPWQFPLVVDQADAVAARLGAAGVPVVRFGHPQWPGVDASVCANSAQLAASVLALPCHQELQQGELEWMIAEFTAALHA